MHGCDHLSCLSVSVTRIGDLSASAHRVGSDLSVDVRKQKDLCVSCSIICSVNKDTNYWMWNASEILYWDNNEIIALEWE